VRRIVGALPGVEHVLDRDGQRAFGLDHPHSGELVALAHPDAWFTYYYWLDDNLAPDFARTVDIHRKPGYDPVELFMDPAIRFPVLKVGSVLAKRKLLGSRALLDVIGLDASLVKGSHGRLTDEPAQGPVFISGDPDLVPDAEVAATDVKELLLAHLLRLGTRAAVAVARAQRLVLHPAPPGPFPAARCGLQFELSRAEREPASPKACPIRRHRAVARLGQGFDDSHVGDRGTAGVAMKTVSCCVAPLLVLLLAAPAIAHESRPGYLELREVSSGRYEVLWKQPAVGDLVFDFARAVAGLIVLIDKGTISSSIAKDVFAKMYDSGRAAADIVAADGLAQISDSSSLAPIVKRVVGAHPDIVAEIRAGKDRKFQFLVGQVMKETKGQADPRTVSELVRAKLQP
jgi:hypothetical protein